MLAKHALSQLSYGPLFWQAAAQSVGLAALQAEGPQARPRAAHFCASAKAVDAADGA